MSSGAMQNGCKAELTADVLRGFGSARIRVQGSSMLPSLRPGDEVDLQSTPFDEIAPGNIIAYRRENRLFVHRVIGRNLQQLITRGDTLPQADAPVTESEFLGVVTSVFRKGEKVDQRNSFPQRAAAALFRRSRLCAALFVKFGALTLGAKAPLRLRFPHA